MCTQQQAPRHDTPRGFLAPSPAGGPKGGNTIIGQTTKNLEGLVVKLAEEQCAVCIQEARIRALETQQVENHVYLKVIREDVAEIKSALKQPPMSPLIPQEDKKNNWLPVVLELIKLITVAILILGGVAGVTKLLGGG